MPKPEREALILIAVLFTALLASDAFAYRMWIETDRDVETMVVGDRVSVSLHLDTEGESDLTLLSIGTFFDSSILSYDVSASSSTEYVLYAPGGGKSQPATWLEPWRGAPQTWGSGLNPDQINSDFLANTFLRTPTTGTSAISSDELLSIMVFEQTAFGEVGFLLAAGAGNILANSDHTDLLAMNESFDLGAPIGHVDTEWMSYDLPDGCRWIVRDGSGSESCPNDEDADLDDDATDDGDGDGDGDDGRTGDGGGYTTTEGESRPVAGVPEPSAALLFAAGLLAARGRLRRRA